MRDKKGQIKDGSGLWTLIRVLRVKEHETVTIFLNYTVATIIRKSQYCNSSVNLLLNETELGKMFVRQKDFY